MSFEDVINIHKKWLDIQDEDLLKILYAAIIGNRYSGNPIWILLIGPASSGKTILLEALDKAKCIYTVSKMTPAALASGRNAGDSILIKARNKVLVIKDMSAIMTMHHEARNEVFSTLRDAYDGKHERMTGGHQIIFKGKIGLIAAATGMVEFLRTIESALGERFITVRMVHPVDIDQTIAMSMKNTIHKEEMQEEMQNVTANFLNNEDSIRLANALPSYILKEIAEISKVVVALRTSVIRDPHTKQIEYPAEVGEMPMRFMSQLAIMALALSSISCSFQDIKRIMQRLLRDGIPYTRMRVLQAINNNLQTQCEIAEFVKVSQPTVSRILEELGFLGVLGTVGKGYDINNPILKGAL